MSENEAILAHHGRSFHWAGRWLPGTVFQQAAALYALCRRLDDAVDHAANEAEARHRLEQTVPEARRALTTLLAQQPAQVVPDTLCHRAFDELVTGMGQDLDFKQPKDEADMVRYGYRAAGTVGVLMARVLQVKAPEAVPFAIDLGIAMQLTNIARDIREDYERGRVYLPRTHVDPAQIRRDSIAYMPRLLRLADRYYKSAESGMAYIPAAQRLAILIAATLYRAIARPLEKAPALVWDRRVYTGHIRKTALTVKACGRFSATPSLWKPRAPHDASLHEPLQDLPGAHL